MKKNVKLFTSFLALCIAMIACQKDELITESEFGDLKKANLGMIKSYDNSMVLQWNEALSLAVDNKMPAPPNPVFMQWLPLQCMMR